MKATLKQRHQYLKSVIKDGNKKLLTMIHTVTDQM